MSGFGQEDVALNLVPDAFLLLLGCLIINLSFIEFFFISCMQGTDMIGWFEVRARRGDVSYSLA